MSNTVQDTEVAILEEIDKFKVNMQKALIGNKAAGFRSRRNTITLEKMFKQWRRLTIEWEKADKT